MTTHNDLANAILDNVVTATLLLNDNLVVQFANPAAELLFSQSAKRIVGFPLPSLFNMHQWTLL